MSRPLNNTEKAQLRAMIARTSLWEVAASLAPAIANAGRAAINLGASERGMEMIGVASSLQDFNPRKES